MLKSLRQGDVILIPDPAAPIAQAQRLPHLTLAEGEVTGHRHRISQGQAEMYELNGTLFLRVLSPIATLTHEEHRAVTVPQGNWRIQLQREYQPEGWRYVTD